MARAIRVAVAFTVEVDVDAWDMNYGTGTAAKDIRDDVRQYVENAARGQLEDVGVLVEHR